MSNKTIAPQFGHGFGIPTATLARASQSVKPWALKKRWPCWQQQARLHPFTPLVPSFSSVHSAPSVFFLLIRPLRFAFLRSFISWKNIAGIPAVIPQRFGISAAIPTRECECVGSSHAEWGGAELGRKFGIASLWFNNTTQQHDCREDCSIYLCTVLCDHMRTQRIRGFSGLNILNISTSFRLKQAKTLKHW